MPEEIGQLAEIVDDDSEKDVNFWPEDRLIDVESRSEKNAEGLEKTSRDLGAGYPSGLEFGLRSKNEVDPGHEHLFPPRNKTVIFSQFESPNSWVTGGVGTETIDFALGMLSIITGSVANDDAIALVQGAADQLFTGKESAWQSVVKFVSTTSQTAYIGVGDIADQIGHAAGLVEGYGFKVVNGVLSALTKKNNSETLTTISGVTLTNFNEYRAIYDTRSVSFFVNGILKVRHRTNIFDSDNDVPLTFYIKTSTTTGRQLLSKYVYFVQKN